MKTRVRIGDRELTIEWTRGEDSDGTYRLQLESHPERAVSIERVEPVTYSVLLDGRSIEARVEPAVDGLIVTAGGRRFHVEVIDPRRWNGRSRSASGGARQNVTAPMPGKVVRLLAAEGDAVEEGQGLVVVEAMKMQNELKAPRAGRLVRLAAQAGAAVRAGEVLATVE
jgi:biotin carboxyl carrier protein